MTITAKPRGLIPKISFRAGFLAKGYGFGSYTSGGLFISPRHVLPYSRARRLWGVLFHDSDRVRTQCYPEESRGLQSVCVDAKHITINSFLVSRDVSNAAGDHRPNKAVYTLRVVVTMLGSACICRHRRHFSRHVFACLLVPAHHAVRSSLRCFALFIYFVFGPSIISPKDLGHTCDLVYFTSFTERSSAFLHHSDHGLALTGYLRQIGF
jgi:hypothetical protein